MALAVAQDPQALDAAYKATKAGYINAILIGDKPQILQIAQQKAYDLSGFDIIHEEDTNWAVEKAVRLVSQGKASILMKGNVSTGTLLRAVLNKDWGLRAGALLSHIALFELPGYHKLLGLTDVAMNVNPSLVEKVQIINNAVSFLHRLGIKNPKVAPLCAVETISEKMPPTLDAAILTQMNRRGQITGCIVDGPLAFDNAISFHSAKHKGIVSEVAGDADLLLFPNIEAGNAVYKALAAFGNGQLAAVIVGASAPIVLTSRSDSEQAKLNSILLAAAAS
jgi:phosphate butyryltransferase